MSSTYKSILNFFGFVQPEAKPMPTAVQPPIPVVKTPKIAVSIDFDELNTALYVATDPNSYFRKDYLNKIFEAACLDTTVFAKKQVRLLNILNRAYNISNLTNNTPQPTDIKPNFMYALIRYAAESIFYGYSLIQVLKDAQNRIVEIQLVPRANTIPELNSVVTDWTKPRESLVDLASEQYRTQVLLLQPSPDDFGVLLPVSRMLILKKFSMAYWSQYQEIFGIPFRYATTVSRDKKLLDDIFKNLEEMGSAGYALFPTGTEIKFLEATKGDPHSVFSEAINIANQEIANAIIGSPELSSEAGSYARARINYQMSEDIALHDLELVSMLVNKALRFLQANFNTELPQNPSFAFDLKADLPMANTQLEIDRFLAENFEVDLEYIEKKYGAKVEKKKTLALSATKQPENNPQTVARITAATGAELDKLLKDIYDQKFAGTIIPEQIEQLNRAKLATALGRLQDQYDPITLQWYNRQMRAVYSFSAAKSYTEAQELKALVFDADGNIRPYTQFRADALALYNNYNENWLETEFNTVKRGNQMGRKWLQIQKDKEAYPFLQYIAELDDRVREAHKELHGFIAEVDDAIWNDIYPPNGWNCRCTVKQLSRKQAEELKSLWLRNYDGDRSVNKSLYGPIDEFATNMPENFKRNTGKEAVIETESSVYYKKYSGSTKKFQLRPEKDYNMKSIEQIYQKANLLPALLPSPVQTAQQIDAWFAQNTVNNQISYRWNGITPIDVFFTKDTLKHMKMPKQLAEKRFLLFGSIDDVIKNPDEIWLNESAQVKGFVFIKYYQDKPVVVIVSEKNAIQTLYQLDNPQKNERLGKLIYRK